ncbi:hypothetical protein F5Y01DRAFT_315200 [Xylaria sp. FL0043]|nr:hypothetical protein F5Y01DRAFT_315200 [Xylaria sp. FL0043]
MSRPTQPTTPFDPNQLYNAAIGRGTVDQLKYGIWSVSGLLTLKNFLAVDPRDLRGLSPACFIQFIDRKPESWETSRIAAHMIAVKHEWAPENMQTYSQVAQDPIGHGGPYELYWEGLVKSVAQSLQCFAKGNMKNRDPNKADCCFEAIRNLKELSDDFQSILYIAGIDLAYDRTVALKPNQTPNLGLEEPYRPIEQSELVQRAKVQQLVDELIRLFRGKGKLVFVIGWAFNTNEIIEHMGSRSIVPHYSL